MRLLLGTWAAVAVEIPTLVMQALQLSTKQAASGERGGAFAREAGGVRASDESPISYLFMGYFSVQEP